MRTVMQAADAGHSHDPGGPPRPWFDHPESRRLLLQGIMNAIVVVILEVISKQPTEMGFVQDDHVVQKLPPTTSHPALRLLIPMKVVSVCDLIPITGSDSKPVTVGAKRRWRSYSA